MKGMGTPAWRVKPIADLRVSATAATWVSRGEVLTSVLSTLKE